MVPSLVRTARVGLLAKPGPLVAGRLYAALAIGGPRHPQDNRLFPRLKSIDESTRRPSRSLPGGIGQRLLRVRSSAPSARLSWSLSETSEYGDIAMPGETASGLAAAIEGEP